MKKARKQVLFLTLFSSLLTFKGKAATLKAAAKKVTKGNNHYENLPFQKWGNLKVKCKINMQMDVSEKEVD